jgi:trimeric autotransporter adhesin
MKGTFILLISYFFLVINSFSQSNTCGSATIISSTTSNTILNGTLIGASYTAITGPCGAAGGNRNDVWYRFVAQATTTTITIGGAVTSPRFQIYTTTNFSTCSGLSSVFCSAGASANVTTLSTGTEYLLRVYSDVNNSNTFTISVQHQPQPTRTREVFTDTIIANNAAGLNSAWEITYEDQEDSLWMTENRSYLIRKMHPGNGGSRVILNLSETGSFPNFRRTFNNGVAVWPQGGMMGFAIHPQFLTGANKDFVYIAYVANFIGQGPSNGIRTQTVTNPSTGEAVKGDLFTTYLVRFTYNTITKALENPVALCDTITGSGDHNSGRLIIAPVGSVHYLFYSVGDMGAGQFYNAERTIKSQLTNSYEGKILRFNLEEDGDAAQNIGPRSVNYNRWIPSGAGVAGNPYNNVPPVVGQSAVWSIGHRNVQGLAYGNGKLFASSHGPFSDDEVNILEAGKNYGHPIVIGDSTDDNYNNARGATASFNGWSGEYAGNPLLTSLPLITNESANALGLGTSYGNSIYSFFKAPNGPAGTAGTVLNMYTTNPSNAGWPSIAPSGMDIYTNTKIPGWKNSLLLASLKKGNMMRIKPNATDNGVESIGGFDTAAVLNTSNRFRDLAFDPDGVTIYGVVDRSGSTSGPTSSTPVNSACPGCVVKFTFRGYNTFGGTSAIPSSIAIDSSTTNTCVPGSAITINAANKNTNLWVPITGPDGDVVAEINANGNNLGDVTTSFYVKTGATRTFGGRPYMNRNITITPQFQPVSPSNVSIRLYFTLGELNNLRATDASVTSVNDIAILKNDDICSPGYAGGIISKPVISNRYTHGTFGHAIQANINSFSTFYFASANSTLPVYNLSLSGKANGESGKLEWTVNDDAVVTSFEVERSADNLNFENIGTVTAKGNPGNEAVYNYTDLNAASYASTVYYRLKAKQQTGSYLYTNIIKINFAQKDVFVSIFPNPAKNKTTVQIDAKTDETAQLRLVDNTGRTVHLQIISIVKGKNNYELQLNEIPAGLYYIDISGKTISQKLKLVKK